MAMPAGRGRSKASPATTRQQLASPAANSLPRPCRGRPAPTARAPTVRGLPCRGRRALPTSPPKLSFLPPRGLIACTPPPRASASPAPVPPSPLRGALLRPTESMAPHARWARRRRTITAATAPRLLSLPRSRDGSPGADTIQGFPAEEFEVTCQ